MAPTLGPPMGATGTVSSVVGGLDAAASPAVGFAPFVDEVRALLEPYLREVLADRVREAQRRGPDVGVVAESLAQLALRGGKRLRAVLVAAGYLAFGGSEIAAVIPAAAALELLQVYLLAHDDWMDGDEMRRGGPSVPAVMLDHFGRRVGGAVPAAHAASVLAGDLAAAWALGSLLESDARADRLVAAAREFARMQRDVVEGQVLDVLDESNDLGAVEATYALKTASYTVRGPLAVGARLAGAEDRQLAGLDRFAQPLGVAFQLRDDLLGTFGDPGATGKPRGGDLVKGKRTALLVDALGDPVAGSAVRRALAGRGASELELGAAMAALEASGARGRIERRIAELAQAARSSLATLPVVPAGRELLGHAVVTLTERDH